MVGVLTRCFANSLTNVAGFIVKSTAGSLLVTVGLVLVGSVTGDG